MLEARPFLKWVGGKTQLLDAILRVLPEETDTYYEPFVGGGALFFAMAMRKRFRRAVINDWNQELIDTYRVVRDFPADLISQLTRLKYDKEVFEALRKMKLDQFSPVRRAARMIYLNKTCFNGLYRVNRAGEFNAPFGKFASPPRIFDESNILGCSAALSHFVSIQSTDYAVVAEQAESGNVVYFDPPYVPLNPTSDFVGYTSKGFGLKEQEKLARLFATLARRGVKVMASNSDTEIVRRLYADFDICEIKARRSINSKGTKRGPVGEVIIVANLPRIPNLALTGVADPPMLPEREPDLTGV
jgi:DNA adenine methylase